MLRIRIRDPVIFMLWIRDGKNPGTINIQDHISESLVTSLLEKKKIKFFVNSVLRIRIRLGGGGEERRVMEKSGSGINIADSIH
jgi:hypothetical protein